MLSHSEKPMAAAQPIDDRTEESLSRALNENRFSRAEYDVLKEKLGRTPTRSELGVFSAMWSEHCSYKSSRIHLKKFPTTGPNVVVGPGENAGVVRLQGEVCLAFKMESHNHPSYIEPYQGAATGVGGILRDVFCMGARPIANLNCLRFGSRAHPRTSYLFDRIVKGIGDYGNCVGVPTVGGNVSFDETYNGNCLVNAMTVGMIKESQIFKGYATGVGNLVVYVGSSTGRDGIHGATMASDSFESQASEQRSTVQVGDPFTEKLLLEATLEVLRKGLVIGLQDMGAAGLTSSSFEMASRAETGLHMDLDAVPVRAQAMTAWELLLSESQERMLMVVSPDKLEPLFEILKKWQLSHAVIGKVADTGKVEITYQGLREVDVTVGPLTEAAPVYDRPRKLLTLGERKGMELEVEEAMASTDFEVVMQKVLFDSGTPERIYRQYDHHIGTRTVYGPDYGGAAVLWAREFEGTNLGHLGVAIATACNERKCYSHPFRGGEEAVLKCSRMIAAVGGEPLAITDCLNFGNPEDPEVMEEFAQAAEGIGQACRRLDVPVVSGNVSLYNQTDAESIFPTPMIGMVGRVADVRRSAPAVLRAPEKLFLLHAKTIDPTWVASLAAKVLGIKPKRTKTAEVDYAMETEGMAWLRKATASGWMIACRDVGAGGIALATAKFCLPARLAWEIDVSHLPFQNSDAESDKLWYFGEVAGVYLLSLDSSAMSEVQASTSELQYCALTPIGEASPAIESSKVHFGDHAFSFSELRDALQSGLLL